jgi:hypothetical protein
MPCRNLLKKPFILSEAEGSLAVLCSQESPEGLDERSFGFAQDEGFK